MPRTAIACTTTPDPVRSDVEVLPPHAAGVVTGEWLVVV
jgi:hypothetical protein